MAKTIDRLVVHAVQGRARDIGRSLEEKERDRMATDFGERARLAQELREQIADLSEVVCNQYGLLGQHAPLLMLLVCIGSHGGNVAFVIEELNKLDARINGPLKGANGEATAKMVPMQAGQGRTGNQ